MVTYVFNRSGSTILFWQLEVHYMNKTTGTPVHYANKEICILNTYDASHFAYLYYPLEVLFLWRENT